MKRKNGYAAKLHSRKHADRANAGVAMVMVLIVSAVVMVFCLTLLLVTYTLFSQSVRQTTQLQCQLLAQSMAESLAEELKTPESDLSKYLSAQIQNDTWIAQNASAGAGQAEADAQAGENAVSELHLLLDAGNKTGDYQVSVTLTYSLNVAEDDGSTDGDEKDDQDQELPGENDAGDPGQAPGQPQGQIAGDSGKEGEGTKTEEGNGSYAIKAVICCMRGDGTERDTQSVAIETEYPAVSLQ